MLTLSIPRVDESLRDDRISHSRSDLWVSRNVEWPSCLRFARGTGELYARISDATNGPCRCFRSARIEGAQVDGECTDVINTAEENNKYQGVVPRIMGSSSLRSDGRRGVGVDVR